MNEYEIAVKISKRIQEAYKTQIKPEDNITYDEFRSLCLVHLDIVSRALTKSLNKDLKIYKIGKWAVLKCPLCKRMIIK